MEHYIKGNISDITYFIRTYPHTNWANRYVVKIIGVGVKFAQITYVALRASVSYALI